MCEGLFVALLAVSLRVRVHVCIYAAEQTRFLDWDMLPWRRAPQSWLMMCERRGEQIRTAILQHRDTSCRLTHTHTHTHKHTETDESRSISSRTVRLAVNVYSLPETPIILFHIQHHGHPPTDTAELKGRAASRLREDSSGSCVSLTSELTTKTAAACAFVVLCFNSACSPQWPSAKRI